MNDSVKFDAIPPCETVRTRRNQFRAATAAVALAASLAAMFAPSSAMALDGTWDTSWAPRNSNERGIPGLFQDMYSLGGGGTYADDMTAVATVVQTDGKMLVAGFGWNTATSNDQNACIIRRYGADGSIDTSFSNGGSFVQNWTNGSDKVDCYFKPIALQPDGKILIGGQIVYSDGSSAEGIIERLLPNGSLDGSFNGNGYRKTGIWSDVNSVMLAGNGDVVLAGTYIQANYTDKDFVLITLNAAGAETGRAAGYFDVVGSDRNDTGNAAVMESWAVGTIGNFHSHDEVYVVGVVDNPSYATGQQHHSCGVTAFTRTDGGAFSRDTGFNGTGMLRVDFPVGISDTDTTCRSAASAPGSSLFGPTGVVVGGERYYTPNGAPVGSASYYALEEIDASGAVSRHDNFAFFDDLNEAGAYNSINAMAWDNLGKLVTVGYAGIGANGDSTHAPSDGVVRRFNVDFSVDGTFAADHSGTLFASLDTTGVTGILQSQREWVNGIATDPLHGRIVFVGERSLWLGVLPNRYAWFLGAVHDGNVVISDRIFANGFE
ncbi:MAG: hypothetical protein ABI082_15400 [Dokdonella sp.]